MMQVTDIRIRKINTEGRMKAIVSITFDDAFAVSVGEREGTNAYKNQR